MLDSFLSGRGTAGVAVSDLVVGALAEARASVSKSGRRPDVDVVVVRVARGRAPAEALCCLPSELADLEKAVGESGADSWTIERRTVSVDEMDLGEEA